jgi:hypothetical protein
VTGQNQHHRNRLLAAMRPRDLALLEPHLQIVPIAEGEYLHLVLVLVGLSALVGAGVSLGSQRFALRSAISFCNLGASSAR